MLLCEVNRWKMGKKNSAELQSLFYQCSSTNKWKAVWKVFLNWKAVLSWSASLSSEQNKGEKKDRKLLKSKWKVLFKVRSLHSPTSLWGANDHGISQASHSWVDCHDRSGKPRPWILFALFVCIGQTDSPSLYLLRLTALEAMILLCLLDTESLASLWNSIWNS